MVAVLPSGVPLPLLATALDTLFNRFHAPAVSLLSSTVACAISAGVRSALVVDMGWSETVVTGVYEYREVQSSRSVRAGKLLADNTHKLLADALGKTPPPDGDGAEKKPEHVVSFEECEDIVNRMAWCKHSRGPSSKSEPPQEGLPTVTEQDESEISNPPAPGSPPATSIWLKSTSPPKKLTITYDQLAIPAEDTFFAPGQPQHAFDDEELPIPLLIYRSLLKLPMDVRALCMARIIFTGGCSSVLGLRRRIFDEVDSLIERHGWDPVRGRGVEAYKTNPKLRRGSKQAGDGGPSDAQGTGDSGGGGGGSAGGHEVDGMWVDAPEQEREPELDPIDHQLRKGRHQEKPRLQGQLRAVESLGAWSGASLLNLLKIPALATVERETWREQGIPGASRPTEVDHKVAQRQSMGAGGLMRNTNANWTLGVWGYL
jgi:actin-related protein